MNERLCEGNAHVSRRSMLRMLLAGLIAATALIGAGCQSSTQPESTSPETTSPAQPPALTNDTNKVVLLGTKGGPSVRANSPAVFSNVVIIKGVPYVVDAGYGLTRQLLKAGVPLTAVRYAFITHHHSDHELEYGPMLYTAWANGLSTPIDTYGPTGLQDLDKDWWEANKLDIEVRIGDEGKPHPDTLVTAHDFNFEKEGVVLENDDVKVSALRVPHPLVPNPYAYKFETKDGRIIVFSGDTAYFPDLAQFARGADILVHEVMYGPGIEALAKRIPNGATLVKHLKDSHTLAEDVGRIAQAAEVKTLVLSHFVPGDDPSITPEMWTTPVQENFKGKIVVGKDLLEIPF